VSLALVVCVLMLAAFLAVRYTGGSPNPLNHLGYVPVIIAAYLYGWRGGATTGLLVAIGLGPLANVLPFDGGGVEGPEAWMARGGFFIAIGGLVGLLFDRSRAAETSWHGATLQVLDREREGMTALARGVAAKDGHTGDHVIRVMRLSEDLAKAIGFNAGDAHEIGWAAMLHDVGKLHVPDAILLKPGALTDEEWAVVRQHSLWGAEILDHGAGFGMARRVARWHHENFDGSGYPDRLRRDAIPLEARLVRIVDAFDAMTHHRPYHEPRSFDHAIEEVKRCSGRHFDPEIARLFTDLATTSRLQTINEELASGATPRRDH
jgi:hypothetical protein